MDVNNYINLNKTIIPFSYINHIDRIQLSVRNYYDTYGQVKELFKNEFGKPITTSRSKEEKYIGGYLYDGKLIQLIYYRRKQWFFSINIHDPDYELQSLIRDMLLSLFGSRIKSFAYISQIEFAWDFYPIDQDPKMVIQLFDAVNNVLYLKYSRVDSCSQKKTTCYQGKDGNVRKGTKGLRVYPKKNSTGLFARIELQANHNLIKGKLKPDISSLPIDPSIVRFSDYFECRTGYDMTGMYKLARKLDGIISKKNKNINDKPRNPRSLSHLVRHELLVRMLSGEDGGKSYDFHPPVAQQISGYRKIKEKKNLSYGINHFFPKIMAIRMRTIGPRRGYVLIPTLV